MVECAYWVVLFVWTLVKPSQLPQFSFDADWTGGGGRLKSTGYFGKPTLVSVDFLSIFGEPIEIYSAEECLFRACVGKDKTCIE